MNKKRLLGMLLALTMLFACLAPAAQAVPRDGEYEFPVTPIAGDGVTLEYDEGSFSLLVKDMYGMLRVEESRTLTLTASFEDGWTYNSDYTNYFRSMSTQVTVADGANGSKVFTFEAHEGDFLSKDDLLTVGVYASPAQLPKLEITASVPFSQIGKDEYVDASFTLTLGTKQFPGGDYEGTGSIKGRGNTSWGQPKKPYSIKLSSKASLLGIPKTKKYAIVPSYSDNSMIRNYMAYKASLMLEGIGYAPKCEFVEVYLNGSYNGIYILVERVSIESNKIDIEEASAEDLTGGYLIEKDIDGKIDFAEDQWFDCPYWANQSRDYFVLKEPEPDEPELLDDMLEYLTNYMQALHNAVVNGTEPYTKYVDTPSWTDFIIMQELSKNIDGNLKTSCYMIKQSNDDKLYMTAPWDFDLAFGNPATTWNNADPNHNDYFDCPDATGTTEFMAINSSCPWFDTLYDDHEEFRNTLKERYAGYRDTMVPSMLAMIDSQAAYLASAAPHDESLWGQRFAAGVQQLRSWLTGRIEWLDSVWLPEHDTVDLGLALNAEGGSLDFEVGQHPFTGVVKDGRLCAKSGNMGMDNSASTVSVTLDMQRDQTITFDYAVSSEENYDKFIFRVDGAARLTVSGEHGWQTHTYTEIVPGTHTYTWEFSKDYSMASGSDCVWVDNIVWSGAGEPEVILGDADGNGAVDMADALLTLRLAMGLVESVPAPLNADADGDGSVTVNDALWILRKAMGLR